MGGRKLGLAWPDLSQLTKVAGLGLTFMTYVGLGPIFLSWTGPGYGEPCPWTPLTNIRLSFSLVPESGAAKCNCCFFPAHVYVPVCVHATAVFCVYSLHMGLTHVQTSRPMFNHPDCWSDRSIDDILRISLETILTTHSFASPLYCCILYTIFVGRWWASYIHTGSWSHQQSGYLNLQFTQNGEGSKYHLVAWLHELMSTQVFSNSAPCWISPKVSVNRFGCNSFFCRIPLLSFWTHFFILFYFILWFSPICRNPFFHGRTEENGL